MSYQSIVGATHATPCVPFRFDLNPGTGQPWSDSGEKVKQTNRIYCDAEHPSRLVVPVVE